MTSPGEAGRPALPSGPLLYDGIVAAAHAGLRLEQAVQTLVPLSRREARLAIARGQVWLGRAPCRILARAVRAGQRLRVLPPAATPMAMARGPLGGPFDLRGPAAAAGAAPAAREPLELLYFDRHVVAINKPAGLLSERDRFGAPSVESVLAAELAARGERPALWLVHRLDAGTSGVLLLARTAAAARRLYAAFRERRVRKDYRALCAGHLERPCTVTAALGRLAGSKQGVLPPEHSQAKAAKTSFVPLARGAATTLVGARPITGRTHQIRVHLSHLGHPIVGDALYGGPRYLDVAHSGQALSVSRPLLHAWALAVPHPSGVAGATLALTAPWPTDMQAVATALGLVLPPS